MKLEAIKLNFDNPSAEYRSIPFWAWNSKLEEAEIRWQIREMHKQGIGGFFMHSRDGLETEYMGEQWNNCIKAAVDEAARLGMQAWLYDEDRWPSGTAGGSVPAKYGDASRCKGVTLEVCEPDDFLYKKDDNIVALYSAKIDGMNIFSLTHLPLDDSSVLPADEKRLVVRTEVSGKSEWFNNEAPPDNLNPDSVKHFIESTHEKYKALVGGSFGKTVKGIFTDEPSLADRHAAFPKNRGWIPWTNGFADYFTEKRGYDIFETLPYIYFNSDKSAKIRHDYWRTVAERYEQSYSKVVSEWCEKNGIAFTGHFLQEDKLGLSARVNGSIMPHYRRQHVPGIDMLCECTDEYMTIKQCSSVAHQYGKPVVISETYGCTGWEFTFEGQKWVGDWQYVLGVNRRCQHLALYSIKGCRKRDYPPCFNYNTSWWDKNCMTEDYFARLSSVLTQGEVIRDILVLHPASTAWSMLGTSPYGNPVRRQERDVPAIDNYGYKFNSFIKYLCGMHYDMDLGDETIIAEDGYVNKNRFCIKNAEYKAVILPPIGTMFKSTFNKLLQYLNNGGKIIAVKPLAPMLEGEKTDKLSQLFNHPNCIVTENQSNAVAELEKILPRTVSVTEGMGREDESLLCMVRNLGEAYALFAVNNDRNNRHEVTISLAYPGAVEEWDLLNGKKTEVEVEVCENGIKFNALFAEAGSKLYIINPAKLALANKNKKSQPVLSMALPNICRVRRNMPNVLTLDTCCYSLDGEEWSQNMQVWAMQRSVRDRLEMMPIENNGLLQRYKWVNTPHKNDGKQLKLRFSFNTEYLPENDVYLVIEEPEQFLVTCNGTAISGKPDGWFLDKSFKKLKLCGLKQGENIIEMTCGYLNSMELENCYIIGDFNVNCRRTIVKPDDEIHTGDWTLQGYYHYAGSLTYLYSYNYSQQSGKRVLLEVSDFSAVCIKIKAGNKSYDMPWKSEKPLDITDGLSEGENPIEIEVVSSPRNMMGPFHLSAGKELNTNDSCFTPTGGRYTDNYNVHPYGLMQPPKLYSQLYLQQI